MLWGRCLAGILVERYFMILDVMDIDVGDMGAVLFIDTHVDDYGLVYLVRDVVVYFDGEDRVWRAGDAESLRLVVG